MRSTPSSVILLLPHPERQLPLLTDLPPHAAVRGTLGFGNKRQYPPCFCSSPIYCYLHFSLFQLHMFSLSSPFAIVHILPSQVHLLYFPPWMQAVTFQFLGKLRSRSIMTGAICRHRKDKKTFGKSQHMLTKSKPYFTKQIVFYDGMNCLVD